MFVYCYFSRTVLKSFNLSLIDKGLYIKENIFAYKCNVNSSIKGPHKGTEEKKQICLRTMLL